MWDEKSYRTKCDTCGKYMRYQEPGSSWVFVPCSDLSYEENIDQCKQCTEKYGLPIPRQNVNIDLCSGIHQPKKGGKGKP